MLFGDDLLEFLDDFRMFGSDIVVFVEVSGEIVEVAFTFLHIELPVTTAYTELVGLMEFPVEEVVLLLLAGFAFECGSEGDTVKAIVCYVGVCVGFLEITYTEQFAECRNDVVESEHVVTGLLGSDVSWPTYDEGHADTAFMARTLDATEFSVTAEKFGVCTAFLMRTVV